VIFVKRKGTFQPYRVPWFVLCRNNESGTVLIVTMWIVLVLAGLVLVFSRSMRVEAIASANYITSLQAEAVTRGAVQFVLSQLKSNEGSLQLEGEDLYADVKVGDGSFWILRPNLDDDRTYSFGIQDEASKINLNSAPMEMLLKLPGMTAELAAAIIDWRDADSEVSPGGAESEYYLLLPDPYYCKDAPFETVEELLLVKGASRDLLYGEDTNRNGVLDSNENDADESEPPDNKDGKLDRGLLDYITVYTREPNVSQSGERRINVNDVRGNGLRDLLREVIKEDKFFQVMDQVRGGRPFRNIIDFYFRTGLEISEFQQIADRLTTTENESIVGLINVNTASRAVLLCLPELEESDVDALIAKRASSGTDLSSIAWVAEALPQEKAVAIGGYITTRSFQYSADIVSVSGDGRAYKRNRIVLDTRDNAVRFLYWKDLTSLGWPLDPEIISTLRSGLS
jgi:type II secretory pathway component PulK